MTLCSSRDFLVCRHLCSDHSGPNSLDVVRFLFSFSISFFYFQTIKHTTRIFKPKPSFFAHDQHMDICLTSTMPCRTLNWMMAWPLASPCYRGTMQKAHKCASVIILPSQWKEQSAPRQIFSRWKKSRRVKRNRVNIFSHVTPSALNGPRFSKMLSGWPRVFRTGMRLWQAARAYKLSAPTTQLHVRISMRQRASPLRKSKLFLLVEKAACPAYSAYPRCFGEEILSSSLGQLRCRPL